MSILADLLEERREELLRRWVERVHRTPPPSLDGLPELLDTLAQLLRAEAAPPDAALLAHVEQLGARHGQLREREGFHPETLVREYTELREVLFDLLDEAGSPPSLGQWRLLTRAMGHAIEAAVAQFSVQRQAQMAASAEALQRSETRYLLATRATRNAIWDWDVSTDTVSWNEGISTVFGHAPESVTPHSAWWLEHIHPEDRERVERGVHAVIDSAQEHHWEGEYRYQRVDGSYARVVDRGSIVRDPEGRAVRMVGAMQDVTAHRQAEELAAEEVRRRAHFEQQLIGIVSHDLRNPLSAITLAAATLLRRSELDARQTTTVNRIVTSAERASRMIRDILDFTQARLGGGLRIEPRPLDLDDFLRMVVDEVQLAHPERELLTEGDAHGQVEWDPDRMAQVLTNLLSNAVRHATASTPVTVCTRAQGEYLLLSVHNRGAPVPEAQRSRLFQPMERGPHQGDRSGRSIGLGLFIVDHIVRAHGGTIEVSSTAEQGTTFTVRLPRHAHRTAAGLSPGA